MRVLIPSPLRSYTRRLSEVDVSGADVAALLENLDTAFPGMRFRMIDEQSRIRPHIRIFVNGEITRDLRASLNLDDEVQIVCALSGG